MIRFLQVYVGDSVLKPSEQEEVISQADDKLKSIPNYTKQEIEELLEPALGEHLKSMPHQFCVSIVLNLISVFSESWGI